MKLAGILLLVISGLLLLCVPLSMWWTFEQTASSTTSPAPSDLAKGISQSYVYGIWALPVALAGLVLLMFGIITHPSNEKPDVRNDG